MRAQCLLLLVGTALVARSDGARILGLFPFPARSHLIVQKSLMLELARRGHQVTVMSSYPESKPVPNYTDIPLKATLASIGGDHMPKDMFSMKAMGAVEMTLMMWFMAEAICSNVLSEKAVQELIHSEGLHFDLVVIEAFYNDCFLAFAHKFDAPVVQVCPYGGSTFMADWIGNPTPYAYVPDELLDYGDRMGFWERAHNSVVGVAKAVTRRLIHMPRQDEVVRRFFNYSGAAVPPVVELEGRTALLLLNSHFTLNFPKPMLPNYVQVGGMHIKPPNKLPQDLQKFLDDAPHGVVYFSMGSNLQSTHMPEAKRDAILGAFSKLKQKVLWKWEADTLPGQPPNVRLGKWLPQSDILAHPNVRLFITHGGLLSTQEAVTRGVPLVAIPVFADQGLNARRAVASGYAQMVEFTSLTEETLLWAVNQILDNPEYHENARRLSRIYRDQPLSPMDTAVFWTEYVIRHRGAPHMRSAALDLAWYQYFLLDVIAALALALGTLVGAVFLVSRALLRRLCGAGRRGADVSPKKKKKKN